MPRCGLISYLVCYLVIKLTNVLLQLYFASTSRNSISNKSKIIAIKFRTHFILIFSKENSWNVIYFFYLLHPLLPARFIRLSHFVLTAHKITWLQSEIIVGLSNDGFSLDKIPKPGVYIEELKFLPWLPVIWIFFTIFMSHQQKIQENIMVEFLLCFCRLTLAL